MDEQEIGRIVVFLLIGCIAGWLAGVILRGRGLGLIGNIIIGVIGSYLGAWIFRVLKIQVGGEWIGPIVMSTVGALALLFIIGLFTPVRK